MEPVLAGSIDQRSSDWDHGIEYAVATDVGLRRANNQDSLAVAMAGSVEKSCRRGHLFLVADGMGGHAAGELASKLAADNIPLTYNKLTDRSPAKALAEAVREANTTIHARGQANAEFRDMGTTLDVLVLFSDRAVIAHVGDSRVYRWRANRLEQLTFDHSRVWEMRAAGLFPDGQVPSYIGRNIITRSLGSRPDVQVDLEGPFPVVVGDIFLICSDGLTGEVQDDEIGKILGSLPPGEAVHALIHLANLRGGSDNTTVIVARVVKPPSLDDLAAAGGPRQSAAGKTHPLVLGGGVLAGLIALLFAIAGQSAGLIAGLAGVVLMGVVALIQRYSLDRAANDSNDRPQGKGPYVQVDCAPDAQFVERLADVTEELRQAAGQENWSVNWEQIDSLDARAVEAVGVGDFTLATSCRCRAVTAMIEQLKQQN